MTTSLRSSARYPSGGTPPIHMPFLFDAAILSRMRSPMTSRSNCAKQQPHRAEFGIAAEDRANGFRLAVDPPRGDVGEEPLQSRALHRRAGEPSIVKSRGQAHPAFLPLAVDERLAGLALRLQRIEFLLEPLLG